MYVSKNIGSIIGRIVIDKAVINIENKIVIFCNFCIFEPLADCGNTYLNRILGITVRINIICSAKA